ncbi:hypothetical protein [Actinacidiphila sp. bgisy160]|uniref:hypothetical protein n=1 Tax=Actinacidiphila sp. bgisy160 TaxID=3413796 RepID=UPI003D73852B
MSITVCLPGAAADRVDEAIADAMAPFEIDGTREGELGIWTPGTSPVARRMAAGSTSCPAMSGIRD